MSRAAVEQASTGSSLRQIVRDRAAFEFALRRRSQFEFGTPDFSRTVSDECDRQWQARASWCRRVLGFNSSWGSFRMAAAHVSPMASSLTWAEKIKLAEKNKLQMGKGTFLGHSIAFVVFGFDTAARRLFLSI